MKKHTVKKPLLFIWALSISVALLISAFPQQKVTAGTQDNVLWLVGYYCHDLEDISKDFGKGITLDNDQEAYRCSDHNDNGQSSWENVLHDELDCSDSMFYTHEFQVDSLDNSVTKTRWFTKEGAYKACYNKALAKYNFLASNTCKNMKRDSGNWDECEDAQNKMHNALGCDDRMFQDLNNGYWGPKPNALNDCRARVDAVGNINIKIVGNGQVVPSPSPIKSDAVQSEDDAAGNAAGDDDSDCSGEGLSLGWIICPIVETVSNFGQFIFNEVIRPIMEETPLSTNSNDPTYRSWQGFRFIANILLIVSMLAIVYSQARGGD